jgi:phosphoribosyl-dephospho-CoA transferase
MTLCEHANKLSQKKPYPGRYCIYCGKEIARIEREDGQIVLRTGDNEKFIAVIYKNQQRIVDEIDVEQTKPIIRFTDLDEDVALDISQLISSFQKQEEALSIE